MPLRGTKKSLVAALCDFNKEMLLNHPQYTAIEAFQEFDKVEINFRKFISFITTIPDPVILESLQHNSVTSDQLSPQEIQENWEKLKSNKYASNHIKLSCLVNSRACYFESLLCLNPFNEFCFQLYKNAHSPAYLDDMTYYLTLYYPEVNSDEMNKFLSIDSKDLDL